MSAFSPLNLVEDVSASKKELEEEHTRELEIENAYKTYQEAISLQSDENWPEAYEKYKQLASSAVITNHFYEEVSFIRGLQNAGNNLQPDELSFIPQNVKKIRFLHFRNRGFLHYNILKADVLTRTRILDAERQSEPALTLFELEKDLFYTMLDGFVNCLVYDEADESILRILYDLYTYLDARRLAKFTLEYAVAYASESTDALSISGLNLNNWATLLWERSKDAGLYEEESNRLAGKLSFLLPLKEDFEAQMKNKMKSHSLAVPLKSNASWLDVIFSVNNAMREIQDKDSAQDFQKIACKYFDPYSASETIFDNVSFQFSENDPEKASGSQIPITIAVSADTKPDSDKIESPEVDASVPDVNHEPHDQSLAAEKSSMRLSKRLNPGDSAPVYADDILLIRQYFIETEVFFNNLNDSFKLFFDTDQNILQDIVGKVVSAEVAGSQTGYIHDFLRILNEWKPSKYDAILFPEKSTGSKRNSHSDQKRLIDVLTSFGNQLGESRNNHANLIDTQDSAYVRDYIFTNLSGHLHVNRAKLEILSHLIASITKSSWDDQLYDAVSEWVMQLEPSYLVACEEEVRSTGDIEDMDLGIGIFEILVNSYIVTKEKIEQNLDSGAHDSFVKSVKSNFNLTAIELLRLKDRIERWQKFFQHLFSSDDYTNQTTIRYPIRFFWASNYYVAAKSFSWRDKKYVVVHLNQLAEFLKESSTDDVHIAFPNYPKIGDFSSEGLNRRLSTASILSIFSKILDHGDSEATATGETISLLENILFDDEDENMEEYIDVGTKNNLLVSSVINGLAVLDKTALSSVKEFFFECPVDLKLSLWNILLSYYQKESFQKFQKGFENYLHFVLDFINNSSYNDRVEDKQTVLLSLISCFQDHLQSFLFLLAERKWHLPSGPVSIRQVSDLAKFFEICYVFSLHEEGALYTSRKVSIATKSEPSFQYFKNLFIDCITILSAYCANYIMQKSAPTKESLLSNFLILVHHQLGLRHLCDSSNGLFLRFAEDSLVQLKEPVEKELTQIMSCRYHYKVKLYGQFPIDHYTDKSAEINKKSAEELAVFILPLCFQNNPLTHAPRNDLKQVVEDLFEIIGDPDVEDDRVLSNNTAIVESFIEKTSLEARFIKEAFHGMKHLELVHTNRKNKVAQKGLYFVEAVLMFNFYKIRKKSAQSRTVELERIITILTYDLIYGSNRVESWILLAQAYGYIVEDDLIWTSDKISTLERKVPTANLQRKSLVCYLMAISMMTRQGVSESQKPVMNMLMNSFAKELYSASRSPMDMLAFQVHSSPKFVRQNEVASFVKAMERPTVTQKYCLNLMNKCLDIAVKSNSEDWNSLYYAAKVKDKLNQDPETVLKALIRAGVEAKKQSITGDPILEPVYKFLSLLYKYVKAGRLGVEDGAMLLNMNLYLGANNDFAPETKTDIYKCIVDGLKKLQSLDKKSWYHKPAYRQAIILCKEFDDVAGAKDLLSKYFTLKSNNKTFLVLWKPEYERPGKHFVYMHQYSSFYVTLLGQEQDLNSLILMYPKLRRANSTMISLVSIWTQVCNTICAITRKILNVDPEQEKYFFYTTSYSTFMARAKKVLELTQTDQSRSSSQKNLSLLHLIVDVRKLNNGIGPTAVIDNIFSGIFIEIFREVSQRHKEIDEIIVPDSPGAKVKRLAKKDLFPFAIELATKCKRETEQFLKFNPDILNTYVADYEREAELLRHRKAAEEEKKLAEAQAKEEVQKKAFLEHQRQTILPQMKISRLFAEQLHLKGQNKSMHKMIAATRSNSQLARLQVLTEQGSTHQPAPQSSIDLCGPETLAAEYINGMRRSGEMFLKDKPIMLKEVNNHMSREHRATISSHPHGAFSDDRPDQTHVSSFSPRTHITRNHLAFQHIAFPGTESHPVEIESEDGATPSPEVKRPLDHQDKIEESHAKRVHRG